MLYNISVYTSMKLTIYTIFVPLSPIFLYRPFPFPLPTGNLKFVLYICEFAFLCYM